MPEAPPCTNFPSCGQRHFGPCDSPYIRSLESSSRRPIQLRVPASSRPVDSSTYRDEKIDPLEQRVAALEKLVFELSATKRKRSGYMKLYMRRQRKKKLKEDAKDA